MCKRLHDMTLEELWELFPIVLVPHNPRWKVWADEEMAYLHGLLSDFNPKINHIGSTAIPGIVAKPVVDILVEVAHWVDWTKVNDLMEDNGYVCMAESERRISFTKGYTPEGYAERVFHVHLHRYGDNDEILFRDYLLSNQDAAKGYEAIKLSLLPEFRNDRDGYTEAKTPFVRSVMSKIIPEDLDGTITG